MGGHQQRQCKHGHGKALQEGMTVRQTYVAPFSLIRVEKIRSSRERQTPLQGRFSCVRGNVSYKVSAFT